MRSRPVDLRPSDSELAPAANHLKGDVICGCASGSGSRPSPRLPFTVLVHAFTPLRWRAFRSMDSRVLEAHPAHGLVPDDSSALDPERWRAAGWSTRALGRPARRSPR